ncbi:MAG TPA: peptidoglycan-binding protein [Actinomycetes bacterium]|nr:peptidoglycan-binding protein [Actinomycetes bacterium]
MSAGGTADSGARTGGEAGALDTRTAPADVDARLPSEPPVLDGHGPAGQGGGRPAAPRRGRAARRLAALALAVVVVAAAVAWVAARRGSGDGGADAAGQPRSTTTAAVVKRDLKAQEAVSGTLGYGDAQTVLTGRQGTVTGLAAEGRVRKRGQNLYRVDNEPVPLFYGRIPFWRALSSGVDDGPDVAQLERNLAALGHDPDHEMTVDQHFTAATRAAVKRWQKAQGLEQTGTFDPGDVVLASGPVRVGSLKTSLGASVGPGGQVMEVTSTSKQVTVDLDATRQAYVKAGDAVDVDLPDGRTTTGKVVKVGKVATASDDGSGAGGGGSDGSATVAVTVSLDRPSDAPDLDKAPVDVRITTQTRKGVLAVPVNALLALSEGGYAVEVDEGGARRLLGVRLGTFADGLVEVSGTGLAEGMQVVVPQ